MAYPSDIAVLAVSFSAVQAPPVRQWMRDNDIRVVRTRKYKTTTDSNHHFNIAPNWLDRDFHADYPNQKWAGDISYIWTREGWLYLAVMIDLHSRRVVGWAVSNRLKKDLALQALNRAVALRNPPPNCIHHTDRHSQRCKHRLPCSGQPILLT